MDWQDLHYAVEVARAGSVAAAARALGVAQSTVYRRISGFEEQTGATLFDRRGGAYVLTEAGKALLAEGLVLDARIGTLARGLKSKTTSVEGDVTVACPELLAIELARLLAAFRAECPRVQVRLLVGAKPADLARHEADIALRATASPDERLVGRRLADIAFAVYASTAYASSHGPTADLSAVDWVCFDDSLPDTPQRRWERTHVPAARVALTTNSRAAFLQGVLAGVGVGVLPCGTAARTQALVAKSAVLPQLTIPLWFLAHAEVAKTPRVRAVIDYLSAAITGERSALEGKNLA